MGDDALKAFPLRVREHLRQGDVCARLSVAQTPLLATPVLHATVSIGAATLGPGQSLEALLQAADTAVYAAKRGGRNQVQS